MSFPYFPQKHEACFLVKNNVSLFHEAWCQGPNGTLPFHPNPSGWLTSHSCWGIDPWRPRKHSDSYIYIHIICMNIYIYIIDVYYRYPIYIPIFRMINYLYRMSKNLVYLKKNVFKMEYVCHKLRYGVYMSIYKCIYIYIYNLNRE